MALLAEAGNRPDYYLLHPPKQPKREIADYVESCGIRVPQRFATLADALSSGKPFMARSEHPQDYAGASDLMLGLFVKPEDFLEDKIRFYPIGTNDWADFLRSSRQPRWVPFLMEHLAVNVAKTPQAEVEMGLTNLSFHRVNDYCRYSGIDPKEFRAEQSYSYWEGLAGFNRAIIADDTVPNRYFIFTTVCKPERGVMWQQANGYQVIEEGKVVKENTYSLPKETTLDFDSLIDFYESVRDLDRFPSSHCPLVEAQTYNGKHHFLQYLRVRDFHPASFSLDRDRTEDEFEAVFVRGATPPDGFELTLNVRTYPSMPEEIEEAGYEANEGSEFLEALAPKRKLQLVGVGEHHDLLAAGGHLRRSILFKPEMTVVLDYYSIRALNRTILDPFRPVANPIIKYRIHIVSDGKKAYLKRLD